MPISIFLICRRLKEDAEYVFYSKNHFLLIPGNAATGDTLDIYSFLAHIPKSARRHLRSLTWAIEATGDGYLRFGDPRYQEWLDVVGIFASEINLSQFSFTIDRSLELQADLNEVVPEESESFEAEQTVESLTSSGILADSLAQLGPFKNLFFHLTWPFIYNGKETRDKYELELERRVMGKTYNGNSGAKFERRHQWNGYDCVSHCDSNTCWMVFHSSL